MEAAPRWFRRLPRAPLEVRAVEAFRQETAAVAFYNRPSPDGSRPGIFYVNLADMNQVLRPQVEAIAYHEGAPGHHFQIALAQELAGVPKFRRFGGYGAYAEGWGLYAEGLGKEMGFYREPITEFGMYSTQLWRAIRLVVDTGIHHQRWTRERAIDYFMDNGLLSRRDATKEVERYFNNPGQATSYMIGQLKILELRDRARAALGNRFDIRDFHAVVLENGAVPLDVLEELVDAWIATAEGRHADGRRNAPARPPLQQSAQPAFRHGRRCTAASASASRAASARTSRNIAPPKAGSASRPARRSTATACRSRSSSPARSRPGGATKDKSKARKNRASRLIWRRMNSAEAAVFGA